MITYSCDQCNGPIGNPSDGKLHITATTVRGDEHFCSVICLSGWAVKTGYRETSPKARDEAARASAPRTCEICGRAGLQRFIKTETGWRCAPTATKCPGNRPRPAENMPGDIPVAESPIRVVEKTVRELVEGCFDKVVTAAPVVDEPAPAASDSRPKPEPAQVNSHAPVDDSPAPVTAPSPHVPRLPVIAARCSGCTRTWNLTGRQLELAINMHEHRSGHVVDIEEN